MVAFRTLSTSACSRLPIRLLAFSPQQPVQLIVKTAQQATSRARRTHLNRPATDFSPLLPPESLNHVIKNSLRCPPGANMTNLQEMTFVSVCTCTNRNRTAHHHPTGHRFRRDQRTSSKQPLSPELTTTPGFPRYRLVLLLWHSCKNFASTLRQHSPGCS